MNLRRIAYHTDYFIFAGGNTGIGKETIRALLQHNAKVYLAARSKEKADAAIADLKAATGKEALFLELDLASLASVKMAAEDFLRFGFSRCSAVRFEPEAVHSFLARSTYFTFCSTMRRTLPDLFALARTDIDATPAGLCSLP